MTKQHKIVNKSGVPNIIYQGLLKDYYDHKTSGDLSATTLLKPIQMTVLERRYGDRIEVDCLDRLWSLFGSAIHEIFDGVEIADSKSEERLRAIIGGLEVTGKYDRIIRNALYDFKVTSAWTIVYESRLKEWARQLSIYRLLYYLEKQEKLYHKGYIIAILRDWAERNVKGKYPISPIIEVELDLIPIPEIREWVEERVEDIKAMSQADDTLLPECTDDERWHNAKKGYIRCQKYCIVRDFCQQLGRENDAI